MDGVKKDGLERAVTVTPSKNLSDSILITVKVMLSAESIH